MIPKKLEETKQPIHVPIETPIGYLAGRDAIYLDKFEYASGKLSLEGSINGHLASNNVLGRFVNYKLVFWGTLAFKSIELDSWDFHCESSFDEIINSSWQAKLGGKVTKNHRHFFIQTYDDVIEVICRGYELILPSK